MDRLRSTLAAPGGARTVGLLVALAGVALLIVGVVVLGGGDSGSSGAAPAPSPSVTTSVGPSSAAPTRSTAPSRSVTPSRPPSTAPSASRLPTTVAPPPPAAPARAPLTVLNNSTIQGLADRAATQVQDRGWQVAQVGNFAGRLVATTVYFTPGSASEEAAARELAKEFPQVTQVLPRYAGLPPTPAGIVLVITKDW